MNLHNRKLAGLLLGVLACALPITSHATILSFQQGVDGYSSAQDAELRQDAPDTNFGDGSNITIDGDDASGPLDDTNALLMFGNIFGAGLNQIPLGSIITSATLGFELDSPGDDLNMLQMLVAWDEATATWNSLGNGIQDAPGEASFLRLLTNLNGGDGDLYTVDVLSEVSLWAAGASNYGWGLTPTDTDGVDYHSTNHVEDSHEKPILTVSFRVPSNEVPEPGISLLLGLGLLGMMVARGKNKT